MELDLSLLITYIIACTALVIVPGPNVTVIIANSINYGMKAGFMSVAGTQFGISLMFIALGVGLEYIISELAAIFEIIRYIGAAYLIWLGYKMIRSNPEKLGPTDMSKEPCTKTAKEKLNDKRYFWQGFLVLWSNPKALVFLSAFVPQFIQLDQNIWLQIMALGAIFILIATVFDSVYAYIFGYVGRTMPQSRLKVLQSTGGTILMGGGVWLALNRG